MREKQFIKEVKIYRNLPMASLMDRRKVDFWRRNQTCGLFPRFFDVKVTNTLWQKLNTSQGTVMLYAAYYDNRLSDQPMIRVIAAGRETNRLPPLLCHLWFEGIPTPFEVPVASGKYLVGDVVFKHWHPEMYLGHLLTCPIPKEIREKIPVIASLVASSCDKSYNALKVWNNRPKEMGDFAVCLKCLWSPFQENHVELAEWIELNLALGASSIQIYVLAVMPKTMQLLDYYEQLGQVKVFKMEWPGSMPVTETPVAQKWFHRNVTYIDASFENFAYNDCLYRNIYSYKFLAVIDMDEVLMPVKHNSWPELFNAIIKEGKDPSDFPCLMFHHFYFFGNKTTNPSIGFKILDTDLRTDIVFPKGFQVKGFFNTQKVLIAFNHFHLGCISNGSCNVVHLDPDMGQLNHYRSTCVRVKVMTKAGCDQMKENLVLDTLASRFAAQIRPNVYEALAKISSS
ncbi:uncharacterized protein LOC131891837 isoform X2 [Tigriopus californicus]|nr:uncharacterized protein LOC131891837 isoform X2 [Tigriopus californicus]